MSTIKIKGYATKEVNADVVKIKISFTAKNAKIVVAQDEVKKQSEMFLKEMSQLGIGTKEFQLEKDESGEKGYGDNESKYATRTLKLSCRFDPKIINAIISTIIKNNLEASVDTDYYYSNRNEIQNELLQEAIQNSRNKANTLANANGQTVKYAESIGDNAEDYYDSKELIGFGCGNITGLNFDEKLLSNILSAKSIRFTETVYVTWVVE